jgi:putative transposase
LKAEETRQLKAREDEADYKVLQKVLPNHQVKIGALLVKISLENDESTLMNHKRIRLIMTKSMVIKKDDLSSIPRSSFYSICAFY